jgi:large subunit ribosomal protein L13
VRTHTTKPAEVTRQWHVIDATDVVLGRLATQAATLLRGKHKPTYAAHIDTGDFVIVINAGKVALSGAKRTQKLAHRHSGHPGGLTSTPYGELLDTKPEFVIEKAIKGMLPHTKLGRQMASKLKVYAGDTHPHGAQQPVPFTITQIAQ